MTDAVATVEVQTLQEAEALVDQLVGLLDQEFDALKAQDLDQFEVLLSRKNHLLSELSRLTGETKTEAIRRALEERKRRLSGARPKARREAVVTFLKKRVWPTLPKSELGRVLTRAEEDAILGYGPDGV